MSSDQIRGPIKDAMSAVATWWFYDCEARRSEEWRDDAQRRGDIADRDSHWEGYAGAAWAIGVSKDVLRGALAQLAEMGARDVVDITDLDLTIFADILRRIVFARGN